MFKIFFTRNSKSCVTYRMNVVLFCSMECQYWIWHLFSSHFLQLLLCFLKSSHQYWINNIFHLGDAILISCINKPIELGLYKIKRKLNDESFNVNQRIHTAFSWSLKWCCTSFTHSILSQGKIILLHTSLIRMSMANWFSLFHFQICIFVIFRKERVGLNYELQMKEGGKVKMSPSLFNQSIILLTTVSIWLLKI